MHLSGTQNASVSSFLPVCASLTHENTEIVTGTFSDCTDADLENYSCNFSISYFFVSQF